MVVEYSLTLATRVCSTTYVTLSRQTQEVLHEGTSPTLHVTVSSRGPSTLPSEHRPSITSRYLSVMPLTKTMRRWISKLSAIWEMFFDAVSASLLHPAATNVRPMIARASRRLN